MINFDNYTNEKKTTTTEHNSNWPYVPDHSYRILTYKIYLYAKDPYQVKYQYLINKREKVGLDYFNNSKAFMKYSNDMHDVYNSIEKYNPNEKRNVLIAFDDMIADMINNKRTKSNSNRIVY